MLKNKIKSKIIKHPSSFVFNLNNWNVLMGFNATEKKDENNFKLKAINQSP